MFVFELQVIRTGLNVSTRQNAFKRAFLWKFHYECHLITVETIVYLLEMSWPNSSLPNLKSDNNVDKTLKKF